MPDNKAFKTSADLAAKELIALVISNARYACLLVEKDAKKGCPVDMGQLRASITSEVDWDGGKIIGRIGSNLDYAPYVHQGTGIYAADGDGRKTPWGYRAETGKYKGFHWTKGQRPQPFLKKAVLRNKNAIEQALGGGHGD